MKNFSIFIVIIALLVGYGSVFTVKEGTRAIVITFGKVQQESDGTTVVRAPGLHFKLPIFDRVEVLDA